MSPSVLTRVRRACRGDDGVVLGTVLLTGVVMTLIAVAALGYVTAQMPQARTSQDRQAALAAAESGIEDYLLRVNRDTEYFTRGFNDPANAAFGQFVSLPGARNTTAQYRIDDVLNTSSTDGLLTVTATGRVGASERTVTVQMRRAAFTDYAYLSDREVNDPTNPTKYLTRTATQRADLATRCAVYAWRAPRSSDCAGISWTKGDVARGQLHTNDLLAVSSGAKFEDHVSSGCSAPGCGDKVGSTYKNYSGSGGSFRYPADGNGHGAIARGVIPFPQDNKELKQQTRAPGTGCLFTGPTRIVLRGDRADVYSRNSKATNGPSCGGATAGKADYKVTIPMTQDGLVIYVQNMPADPTDPNHTASPYSTAPFVPGPKPGKAPATYRPNPASPARTTTPDGFPLPQDRAWLDGNGAVYGPGQGDVFIEGSLDGRLTVGAEDDVFITSDLTYTGGMTGDDVLGVIANNFLWNYHPVSQATAGEQYELCDEACMEDVRIQAAMMSVKHAYGTVYPDAGASQGTIHIQGSLVQLWRNNVGGGTFDANKLRQAQHQGYAKDYAYDPRLRYTQPPHFLAPESLVWEVSQWAEA